MIKVIITINNDILYNSLSNISLQHEGKIEIKYIPTDKLKNFICRIKPKEPLIILDSNTSVAFHNNMLKNVMNRMDKANIIILVVDFKTITNIINQEKSHFFTRKDETNFSVLQFINTISETVRDTMEIEKTIDSILWKLGFATYFKGTIYLKTAILLAYSDNKLLQDMNILVKKVTERNNAENEKVVRSVMDKSINNVLDYLHTDLLYEVFEDDYDGRKVSVKYFIDLCIRYLGKKERYCCSEL